MKSYNVRAERDGRWWLVHVPELDALTQARRYTEVEEMARSLIAVTLDVEPDSFDLDVSPLLDEDVEAELAAATLLAATAERAAAEASVRKSNAASLLKERGWTVREIGALLGLSFQRAHQLTKRS